MHIGLMMECDYRAGRSQREAFDEAFVMAETAETAGFDGVWLAERHFAPPGGTGPIPSVASAPIVWASAIAARTSQLRVGTAVLVLPLGHPVRMAEEVATLDNISQGRMDLGIGRSSFPRSYEGYDVPYAESRVRFEEFLQVMRLAFTQERFSYSGKYYTFRDVCLIPKPYQQPHPPLRAAATTRDTFAFMGNLGLPIFASLGAAVVEDIAAALVDYRAAWRAAGHAGDGDVILRLPIYVAPTMEQALAAPQESTMHHYARLQQAFLRSAGTAEGDARATRAARLATLTYEDVVQERTVFGTPEHVVQRLKSLQDQLGLSGLIMESNVGGRTPQETVVDSIRLFGQAVAPQLRAMA
ncbi:MAG: LLM class flavin-dependent oxidoreductase [Candidatus Tectomicrobia bacterium]|uniref:LLM class flavin-dependent oxidoreductase n=1 Tax=Tectimicrobiota bacterium TaxID=2528274 RepID=A0A937VYC4_UNCTE|nr:LLM class flavin-dependent oxidoreductase [Candidatus Tectomicrobia bacterium]